MMMSILMVGIILIAVLALLYDYVFRDYFRRRFANDANRARIYIKCGDDIAIVKGKRLYVADDGQAYAYNFGGMDLAVIVPPNYGYYFVEGSRCIAVTDGQTLASPFKIGEAHSEGVCDVSAIVIGDVVVELVKSLTGKGQSKWMWLIIGGAVVFGLYFAYTMFTGGGEPPPVVPGEIIDPDTGLPLMYFR